MKSAFVLALPFLVFCTRLLAQTPTITNINLATATSFNDDTIHVALVNQLGM